jgi:uncharacterized membrane protein
VPAGTEGGVSLAGTGGGLGAAMWVAGVGAATGLVGGREAALAAVAGLAGSLVESVLGAVAAPRGWIGDHGLNAVNTALGAAFAVALALALR